jgi:ATP-dependent RNA helicase RhlE
MKFENLKINETILKAIKEKWYTEATPIQEKAIPILLEWTDLIWCAQTWTWKTASFAIPTIQLLNEAKASGKWWKWIWALIVTPTRELAIQIDEWFKEYWKWSWLRNAVIFWWVKQHWQVKKLKSWIDILTATPWRLLDLINQWEIRLGNLEVFILDEADRMLDMWFIHDIKKIIAKLPKERHSMFFSATMPDEIIKLSNTLLTNPKKVEVTPISSTADTIEQKLYRVDKSNKKHLLNHILEDKKIESLLVFSRTKHWANRIAEFLEKSWNKAAAIHWNKSQNARQKALEDFKSKEIRVLVATDIAARWIDISKLSYVVNFDLPAEPESYVHRIWRTWRAKNTWLAMSFCEKLEERQLKDIEKLIKKSIPLVSDHPFPLWSASDKCELDERWWRDGRKNKSWRNSQKNYNPRNSSERRSPEKFKTENNLDSKNKFKKTSEKIKWAFWKDPSRKPSKRSEEKASRYKKSWWNWSKKYAKQAHKNIYDKDKKSGKFDKKD